ncbi:hypothetical protein BGW42_007536, partial [Actinomortierella wolfii]
CNTEGTDHKAIMYKSSPRLLNTRLRATPASFCRHYWQASATAACVASLRSPRSIATTAGIVAATKRPTFRSFSSSSATWTTGGRQSMTSVPRRSNSTSSSSGRPTNITASAAAKKSFKDGVPDYTRAQFEALSVQELKNIMRQHEGVLVSGRKEELVSRALVLAYQRYGTTAITERDVRLSRIQLDMPQTSTSASTPAAAATAGSSSGSSTTTSSSLPSPSEKLPLESSRDTAATTTQEVASTGTSATTTVHSEKECLSKAALAQAEEEELALQRLAKEKAEWENQQRLAQEKAYQEQLAREQAAEERLAAEMAEKERLMREQVQKERLAKEQAEKEQLAKEQAEKDRLAKEQAEKERLAKEQAEKERLVEKMEKERIENKELKVETKAKPTTISSASSVTASSQSSTSPTSNTNTQGNQHHEWHSEKLPLRTTLSSIGLGLAVIAWFIAGKRQRWQKDQGSQNDSEGLESETALKQQPDHLIAEAS